MKQYYLSIAENQTGPFSLEEIKVMSLPSNTLIWEETMPTWIKASELYELKKTFKIEPPPLPDKKFVESKAINKALIESVIPFAVILIVTLVVCGWFSSDEELHKSYGIYEYHSANSSISNGASTLSQDNYSVVDAAQIRAFIFGGSLLLALTLSLLILIIEYRTKIKREISRLKL